MTGDQIYQLVLVAMILVAVSVLRLIDAKYDVDSIGRVVEGLKFFFTTELSERARRDSAIKLDLAAAAFALLVSAAFLLGPQLMNPSDHRPFPYGAVVVVVALTLIVGEASASPVRENDRLGNALRKARSVLSKANDDVAD